MARKSKVKSDQWNPSLRRRPASLDHLPHIPQDSVLAYASLPPTPISPSPSSSTPVSPTPAIFNKIPSPPFSLWDYLREELLATDFDSHQELKWERVSNFLNIPIAIEHIIGFGYLLCLDSFLYTFTILPIRFAIALWRLISFKRLPPSQKADLLRALLLVVTTLICIPLTDASKIYHTIRGQDTIKLYVIFNALEMADRLCASIGQDILDCLFSRSSLVQLSFRPIIYFFLAALYTISHTFVMLYQLLSLNVAINAYDHTLLTLLVSNQFVEIKASVFKKFEKDNLFQLTCADIVERFTLSLMLLAVAFRNLIDLTGSAALFDDALLPLSFGWSQAGVLWTIGYPVLLVMLSEFLVDSLKHAFITKFNHIRPTVYARYMDVLCRDLACGSAVGRRKHTYVDQSPLVARRLGFAPLPLAILSILICGQNIRELDLKWSAMALLFWLCFLGVKIILGVNLVGYATSRQESIEAAKRAEDKENDFGRPAIGEGNEERAYNSELKGMLDDPRDDVVRVAEMGEGTHRGRQRVKLEDLTRFTMVKRIW
ncbi:DUF747-domain-containing protein [Guyanagaster necrorhizus]|uniref:DUF747-domain-containing protein n=1 Tax=Guyanagaster necrorhizus TaxID=856835 RepID=A0A9P7VT89_9AGAR|nr:DUF747-domain-containing protein [Guyanagaster necrorhizus MCA 3950]KAG7446514.1 DUF747-domain-containing protein [Guyanagaster necrorhizus MCA 3950]